MTKLPASTLSRRAKTKNHPLVKRHRAKAAQLRREIVDRAEKISAELDPVLMRRHAESRTSYGIGQVLHGDAPLVSKPWYETEERVAELMVAAKKPELFKQILSTRFSAARAEAREVAQKEGMAAVAQNSKAWQINIISAFLAKCETLEQVHRGMPKTAVVDGLTLARVVDALRDAGYTADGKSGRPQWREVGR